MPNTELLYQTSHGPLTLEQIMDLSVDPMFYVRASDRQEVHPDRRGRLNMDRPKLVSINRNHRWGDVTFNNDEVYRLPVDIPMGFVGNSWNGTKVFIETTISDVMIDGANLNWDVLYFSRVRRSGKYCQIRHSLMPTGERLWEHRFVYAQWNREDITGYEVHHIDENPYNNCPENLQKLTRSEHARHTGLHQTNFHGTRNLDGSFAPGGGPGRIATVPQPMPERLRTINNHQFLKIRSVKNLGVLDTPWMDMEFVDKEAMFVVNSFFFRKY